MRLRQLELHGFKSFAKKTQLSFDTPITAIVGPNGSGKSNVVEAIRFVLGEQSMKSLRGGSGTDLIFRGSGQARDMNRAYVAITFDNRDRIFALTGSDNQQLSLDFDEIVLSREIVRDGVTTYAVNGTTVRLKDILEIIASVHIGSSGHHIISQGEADRLLNASPRERKSMLEDALGLKAYQYKIDEATRKLDKTSENLREAYTLRRELGPQLKFLERQVKKIEQAKVLQEELEGSYRQYLAQQQALIKTERTHWYEEKTRLQKEQDEVTARLETYRADLAQVAEAKEEGEIIAKERERQQIARDLQDLERKLGKVEAMVELAEASLVATEQPETSQTDELIQVRQREVERLVRDIDTQLQDILAETIEVARSRSGEISAQVTDFFAERQQRQPEQSPVKGVVDPARIEELRQDHRSIVQQIQDLKEHESEIADEVSEIRKQAEVARANVRDQEQAFFELSNQLQSLQTLVSRVDMQLERLEVARQRLQEEITEAEVLVGRVVVDNLEGESIDRQYQVYDEVQTTQLVRDQEQLRREIERKKIKLEELGATADRDVVAEYETTKERDEFYEREISDLESSIVQLGQAMQDLTTELEREFREGLRLVNDQFDEFFTVLFGGGSAHLEVVDIERRRRSTDGEDAPNDEEPEIEQGIEITVKLPRKKVQTLTMLSGGERSLTSIALLFALSQVKPPPFLVLDETDAALDEANSQRYGDMIERLAEKTQLITVTHNRETMSRAQVLYGVTLDQGGGSQVLSVKFEQAAENYAK